jgi:hypothetical protein
MLQVKSVLHSDGFEGMGSIVEVVVVYAEKDVQHDIRKDFDFARYGEVNLIERPRGNPPEWTIAFKTRLR